MDGSLRPYSAPVPNAAHPAGLPSHPHSAVPTIPIHGGHPAAHGSTKTAGDYFRAMYKRAWLLLGLAVPVAVGGSLFVMRMKDTYRTQAQITIEPPHFDDTLLGLLTHQGVGRAKATGPEARFVANGLMKLRSMELARKIVFDPGIEPPPPGMADPAFELWKGLTVKSIPQTNRCDVILEGNDPKRITEWLNRLVDAFCDGLQQENIAQIGAVQKRSSDRLDGLRKEQKQLDAQLRDLAERNKSFASGGRNLLEQRYLEYSALLLQKRNLVENMRHEAMIAQYLPQSKLGAMTGHGPDDELLAGLDQQRRALAARAKNVYRLSRHPADDPAAQHLARQMNELQAQIDTIRGRQKPVESAVDVHSVLIDHATRELEELEKKVQDTFAEWQVSNPAHQDYVARLADRDAKAKEILAMEARLGDFNLLALTNTKPAEVIQLAVEPVAPVKPNRPLMIAGVIILGIGLGAGTVCLLESLDRKVRVPEQLILGLGLPLFGVVPRMRRNWRLHRGGHLWTPGAPASVEADAYRNLRASVLGVHDAQGRPAVTLLVTSAKAGEGKSTTALNLAATCARAGERTLLIDVDLRRPSLLDVFEGAREQPGLVGFLKGETPWQSTIVRTDLPNLDFLPTGDPRDVPIEILGALELRQLIASVSRQYDRVILDGPAVLGLADCRMLGRIVDAAILVVRSGAHELKPLYRAKVMLEQSRVPVAGLVFNGLADDFQDWSSYGSAHYGYGEEFGPAPGNSLGMAVALGSS
ncbi:MAG: polysaccharide biosynthesis tyrosine autokinase [Isosphaeraceae bacterium]